MEIWVYDVESFKYDWMVVFINLITGEVIRAHNDADIVRNTTSIRDRVFIGFNNKYYDDHIIKAICCGASPEMVKEISDWIISGRFAWDHYFFEDCRYYFNSADIRNDMQQNLSLKAVEAHLGMPIVESGIPFDISRALTPEEVEDTLYYCEHDVRATMELVKIRKNYLIGKLNLAARGGIDPVLALGMTNPRLTAEYLGATPRKSTETRNFSPPAALDITKIPPEIMEFYTDMLPWMSDEDYYKRFLTVNLGGIETVYGFGGLHAGLNRYEIHESPELMILNYDVASLYPSIMVYHDLLSRRVRDPDEFKDIYHTRLHAKETNDYETSSVLKLVLNSTFGAALNAYNPLYDPYRARAVCIVGQLFMTDLITHLLDCCLTLQLIQINTDGVMFRIHPRDYPRVLEVIKEWENRTDFVLEETRISSLYQKDVNNYALLTVDDKEIIKGGYLTYGFSGLDGSGSFSVSNNKTIVGLALKEYLLYNKDVEATIGQSNDPFQFQMVAYAGSSYSEVVHFAHGKERSLQKVNRVYASKNASEGTLYKVRKRDGGREKIAGLPPHCTVDNENRININRIDKDWYIHETYKRINDFKGELSWL